MWSREAREQVEALFETDMSDYAIARTTGVPRPTVCRWRTHPPRRGHRSIDPSWRPPDDAAYCYLLGLYLGDGCITQTSPAGAFLQIALDAKYEGIVREAVDALEQVFPGANVRRYRLPKMRVTRVQVSEPRLLVAFPQHGPGKKHLRKIELVDWQRRLTTAHPGPFVRGLIHSDGCRCINRFKTRLPSGRVAEYSYPRYFFTNLSEDIRRLFCEHLDLLGVDWSQSNHRNISVHDRGSVTVLDHFVGPKT